jgi:hypothetical protein
MTETKSRSSKWGTISIIVLAIILYNIFYSNPDRVTSPTSTTDSAPYVPVAAPKTGQCEKIYIDDRGDNANVCIGDTVDKLNSLHINRWRKNRTVGQSYATEQWVYDNQYLYVENGIVTSMQVSH